MKRFKLRGFLPVLVGASAYGIAVTPMIDRFPDMFGGLTGLLTVAIPFIAAVLIARYRYRADIIRAETERDRMRSEQKRLDEAARQIAPVAQQTAEQRETKVESRIESRGPSTASPQRRVKSKLSVTAKEPSPVLVG